MLAQFIVAGLTLLAVARPPPEKPPGKPPEKPPAVAMPPPSHPPQPGCAWERFSDRTLRLEAWVQRCDLGARKVDFVRKGNALAIRLSDLRAADPVIEVLALRPGEAAEHGLVRLYTAHTPKDVASRCRLALADDQKPFPPGVKRYNFVPKPDYEKALRAKAVPDEIPDPPCGDWGVQEDSIQYFEVHPASGVPKVLLVFAGQDDPLFDEATLQLW